MCDYSLTGVPNRLAVQGEELVTHRFYSGSLGLASPLDLRPAEGPGHARKGGFWSTLKQIFTLPNESTVPAVCIPPGARLIVEDIPQTLQQELQVSATEEVTFAQLSATAYTYRDALRFKNGQEVLLQRLPEGQYVWVLDLSSAKAIEVGLERRSDSVVPTTGRQAGGTP